MDTSSSTETISDALFAFRLVSRDGDIIWSTTQDSKGTGADTADKVVSQLLRDIDTQEVKSAVPPSEPPTSPIAPAVVTPEVTGSYSGDLRNLTLGRMAKFEITLREEGGGIYGCTTVGKPFQGSGGLYGHVNGVQIAFESMGKKLRIQFTGELQGDEMTGTYTVLSTLEHGEFALKRASSNAPEIGFDLARCRKN